MVRTLKCLLILHLLIWSNANAWYCNYTPTDNGYILEDSIQCYGIDVDTALETVWCTAHQPSDPICKNYVSCSDQTEQRSIACSEPNTTGLVNESRVYSCNSDSWSNWVVSSNNCVPLPQTCFPSTEERTLECQNGYTGSILEQRQLTCSTNYSAQSFGPWITVKDSCIPKAEDPTSIESPLNPASPLSMDQQQLDQMKTTSEITNPLKRNPQEKPPQLQVDSNPMVVQEALPQMEVTKVETPKKEEKKQEAKQTAKIKVKENEELVPGFGIAISFALIEQPVNLQQQQLTNILNLEQEQNYAREQNILLNLIQSDDYSSAFDSLADFRWRSLLRDFPLQQDAFSN